MFFKNLNYFQEKIVNFIIVSSYILLFISFFRFSTVAPEYLEIMDYYFRIYICLFLLLRFNPIWKLDTFTDLDRKIAFSAGLFILTTTALKQYAVLAGGKIHNILMPN